MNRGRFGASAVFGLSAAGTGWVLVGYPLVLMALPERPWLQAPATPSVTLIVPAFREREALARKLRALEALDYPSDLLEVIVVADGDAALIDVARNACPSAVVLYEPGRGGKAAALNRGLRHAQGDIVVMTDANNVLEPGSLRAAVRHFADPTVWAVAGRRAEDASTYDRYEDLLRRLETRSGSVAAMSGEFMVVRRERMPSFPPDVVNDDFWLLSQVVRAGGRVVYDPTASSDEPEISLRGEVARRSRMSAGRVASLSDIRALPLAFRWRVLSHKHGRLALPFLLLGLLGSSMALARQRPFGLLLGAQVLLYGLGAADARGMRPAGPAGRLFHAAGQFTVGNLAVGLGVLRALRGRQSVRWEPVR